MDQYQWPYRNQVVPMKEREGLRCESCGQKPASNYAPIKPLNKFLCADCYRTYKSLQQMDKVVNGDV